MSKQLDSLIAILRDNVDVLSDGEICRAVNCTNVDCCDDCPLDSSAVVVSLVEELEVLQHAKA